MERSDGGKKGCRCQLNYLHLCQTLTRKFAVGKLMNLFKFGTLKPKQFFFAAATTAATQSHNWLHRGCKNKKLSQI
jgi:hypothetical protein